jgi:hypothetical protein
MTELALMTVEITVTDRDSQGFGLGGPKEQARAMATALAQRLNMAPPADGCLLNVSMTAAELRPIVGVDQRTVSSAWVLSTQREALAIGQGEVTVALFRSW